MRNSIARIDDLDMPSHSEAARRALISMDPAKYEYQSEFARRYFGAGKAEGKVEGQAEIVLKLLTLRFGALPVGVEARLRAVGVEELDGIAVRVLSATTLEEALGAD